LTYRETDLVRRIDRLFDTTDLSVPLARSALDELDQFHGGGPEAVEHLLASLRPGHSTPGSPCTSR
jgi:hypothetical protein